MRTSKTEGRQAAVPTLGAQPRGGIGTWVATLAILADEGSEMADATTDRQRAIVNTDDTEPIFLPPHSGRLLDFLGVTHRLTSEQSGGSIYIFESAFEPGAGNRLHVHSREDEIAYVLEGALEVRLQDRTAVLEAVACHACRRPFACAPQSPRNALSVPVPGRSGRARPMVRRSCRRER